MATCPGCGEERFFLVNDEWEVSVVLDREGRVLEWDGDQIQCVGCATIWDRGDLQGPRLRLVT